MNTNRLMLIAALLALPAAGAEPAAKLRYPEARRVEVEDTTHGMSVADPYRWMEDLESAELQSWMRSQDDLSEAFLRPAESAVETLEKRIGAISSFATRGVPVLRPAGTFYVETAANKSFGTLYLEPRDDAAVRPVLDLEALNSGGNSAALAAISADGALVAYTTAVGQSRWRALEVVRVAAPGKVVDRLAGYYSGGSSMAWRRDSAGFYYSRYSVPDDPQAPLGRPRIFYHRVGSEQAGDVEVFALPEGEAASIGLRVSHDDRYLVLSVSKGGGTFNGLFDRIFYIDLQGEDGRAVELFPGVEATFSFEGNEGSTFWVRTSLDAPRLRVVAVDIADSKPERWRELIPEAMAPIQSVNEVGERLVVQYVVDARAVLRIFDFEGRRRHEIDTVVPAMAGLADDRLHDDAFYAVSTLYDPAVYRLDVDSGAAALWYRPRIDLDPALFVTRQVFYDSKDGTRIPMYLVHRKDLQRDGSSPVFLYGYGAFAWSAFPWQRHVLPWIEAGGVYAVPNIRGGGEYGAAWHRAGSGRNKQNAIDDYLAAAEWLIEQDYTTAAKLVANGGSASGLLPAAAIAQRPELFGAAVINFPALDMVRYTHFGAAGSWISEFGDPGQAEDLRALLAYSPYHRIRSGVCYPPTWIQVGEKDETTTPMHGYKFAAALQAAQACDNPVLLKIAWGAGHSYGLTPEQSWRTQAEELAFLHRVLELPTGESSSSPLPRP